MNFDEAFILLYALTYKLTGELSSPASIKDNDGCKALSQARAAIYDATTQLAIYKRKVSPQPAPHIPDVKNKLDELRKLLEIM